MVVELKEKRMILNRRIIRDLKENIVTYLAVFLLVIISGFLVVAFGGTTYTARDSVHKYWKQNNVEDGEFTVYVPLTADNLESAKKQGASIEEEFYIDVEAENQTIIRMLKKRDAINKVQLAEGKETISNNELILEETFADTKGYQVGDSIQIGDIIYTIAGVGTTADYAHRVSNCSDVGTDENFGIAFVNEKCYQELISDERYTDKVVYNYAYTLDASYSSEQLKQWICNLQFDETAITDTYLIDKINDMNRIRTEFTDGFETLSKGAELTGQYELAEGIVTMQDSVNELLEEAYDYSIPNLKSFQTADKNSRIQGIIQYNESMLSYAIMAGILLSLIIAYMLSIVVSNQLEKDSVSIGTLYALGYLKKELIRHYILLPVLVVFVGAIIGTLLGKSGTLWFMAANYAYPPLEPTITVPLILYGIGMPVTLVAVIEFITLNRKLNQNPLQLIRKEKREVIKKVKKNFTNMGFLKMYQARQFIRESRSYVILFFGLGISILFMMMGFALYDTITHYSEAVATDMHYENMYLLRNPLRKQPENTEVGYTRGYSIYCDMAGTEFEVVLQGIDNQNDYFDFSNELKNDTSLIYVSDSAVVKYGYKIGDQVTLTDHLNNKNDTFTIAGVVPFKNGIYFFMNIDAMREYYGNETDYYNTLFSNEDITIDDAMLVNTIRTSTVQETAKTWVADGESYLILFIVIAIITFAVVMLLLVKMIIDRASFSISLNRVFGFNEHEIQKMYLGSIIYVVILAIIVFLPISALAMNYIIPLLNATMASGMANYISFKTYPIMIFIIMITFFITKAALSVKMNKISFAEILKERE